MIRVKRLIHRQKAAEVVRKFWSLLLARDPARIGALSISIFIASTSAKVVSLGILVANLQTDNLELPTWPIRARRYENFSFPPSHFLWVRDDGWLAGLVAKSNLKEWLVHLFLWEEQWPFERLVPPREPFNAFCWHYVAPEFR